MVTVNTVAVTVNILTVNIVTVVYQVLLFTDTSFVANMLLIGNITYQVTGVLQIFNM